MDLLEKQPDESRVYDMDFSPKMSSAEVINAVSSVSQHKRLADDSYEATAELTFPSVATFSGQIAQQRIEDGTHETTYKVTYVITTDLGNTLEAEGLLYVRDR